MADLVYEDTVGVGQGGQPTREEPSPRQSGAAVRLDNDCLTPLLPVSSPEELRSGPGVKGEWAVIPCPQWRLCGAEDGFEGFCSVLL
jgi:hypothetical protein